jgi:hypothetical protein
MVPAGSLSAQMREVSSQFEDYLARFFRQNAERYAYGPLFEPIYRDLSSFVLRHGSGRSSFCLPIGSLAGLYH